MGAYLYQLVDGVKHPIRFISRGYNNVELKWNIVKSRKDAFAIFYFLQPYETRTSNKGQTLYIKTDNKNLTFLNTSHREKSKDGRNWIGLNSLSGPVLQLNQSIVGSQVRARVAVVDNFGIETNLYSQATRTVENVNNKPSGRIVIRRVGQ